MHRMLSLLMLTVGARALAAQETAQVAGGPSALSLDVGVVARAVVDRIPQDTGTTFPADVGQIVCFTQIEGASADAPTTVHHVWFHGETQVADVELVLRGSPWRTWSRKTVPLDWTGPWHVEIRDGAGAVLQRIDFTVGP